MSFAPIGHAIYGNCEKKQWISTSKQDKGRTAISTKIALESAQHYAIMNIIEYVPKKKRAVVVLYFMPWDPIII